MCVFTATHERPNKAFCVAWTTSTRSVYTYSTDSSLSLSLHMGVLFACLPAGFFLLGRPSFFLSFFPPSFCSKLNLPVLLTLLLLSGLLGKWGLCMTLRKFFLSSTSLICQGQRKRESWASFPRMHQHHGRHCCCQAIVYMLHLPQDSSSSSSSCYDG